MRPSDEAFGDALRALLARSGLSMRGLSAAMGRDPGYVAALLDPNRPSRARPTPEDLLAASEATGIPVAELLETLWGIPRSRLCREPASEVVPGALGPILARLDPAGRTAVADFAAYLADRWHPVNRGTGDPAAPTAAGLLGLTLDEGPGGPQYPAAGTDGPGGGSRADAGVSTDQRTGTGGATRLLERLEVAGGRDKAIELWQGDLTALSPETAVDALVVSAFPNDYRATPGSLIGALDAKGLSVAALALDKDLDLRSQASCWLSRPIQPSDPGLRFDRILCFEPGTRGAPPDVVGDIFRALTPIAADRPQVRSVALPIVAAGDMGYGVAEILEPLLEAAVRWMEFGHPLERLLIVAHSDARAKEARRVFRARAAARRHDVPRPPARFDYEVFISYCHADADAAESLRRELEAARPGIPVFMDCLELEAGVAWQPKIFESLEHSRKVVALLSPDYLASKACAEEFNIAWIRARNTGRDVLFPVYVYSADLPNYMLYWQYVDAREGDHAKSAIVAGRLLAALDREAAIPGGRS